MSDKLLTAEEVAQYLGVSKKEVDSLVAEGKLPAYKIGGSFIRFKLEHVDALRHRDVKIKKVSNTTPPSSMPPAAYYKFSLKDRIGDFLYFNDFYIICLFLIITLIVIIVYF